MQIFKKDYDGESLYDLERDLIECFDERYNEDVKNIPFNEDGLLEGMFTVTVKWSNK
jgi:hypothetical protein